jgi:hypothetical protein
MILVLLVFLVLVVTIGGIAVAMMTSSALNVEMTELRAEYRRLLSHERRLAELAERVSSAAADFCRIQASQENRPETPCPGEQENLAGMQERVAAALDRLHSSGISLEQMEKHPIFAEMLKEMGEAGYEVRGSVDRFNQLAAAYNRRLQEFPASLVARATGLAPVRGNLDAEHLDAASDLELEGRKVVREAMERGLAMVRAGLSAGGEKNGADVEDPDSSDPYLEEVRRRAVRREEERADAERRRIEYEEQRERERVEIAQREAEDARRRENERQSWAAEESRRRQEDEWRRRQEEGW